MREMSQEEREQRMAEVREKMEKQRTEMEGKVKEILLPHQIKRLEQIQVQTRMRWAGTSGALGSEELAEKLGITEEQREKLQAKQEEVQKKLAEKIAKARQEAQDEILSVLTPEQVKKIKDLIGEPFEMQRQRGGPGGRGAQGGRGGA